MRNTFFLLNILVLSLLMNGCARHSASAVTPPPIYYPIEQKRPTPAFSHIDINGIVNVNLSTNCSKPRLVLRGEPRDLANVVTTFYNGTLQMNVGKGFPKYGSIQANICTRYLHSFRYEGQGEINGRGLRASLLDIMITNNGRTMLEGQLAIRKLELKGSGYTQINGINSENLLLKLSGSPRVQLAGKVNLGYLTLNSKAYLSLYWVKSKTLIIRERGNAFVQLAGIADRLDVELWGNARFRGRYLRANTLFVKTHDSSLAEVSAVKRQHTLASGSSDIHFYNIPQLKTDLMAFNGAVLDMRDWKNPWMQEYNQYNIGPP